MNLSREQLQLLVDCAPETTVIYLAESIEGVLTPFLYTANTPEFSGLTEAEYLDLYRADATAIVLPQDMPTLRNTIVSTYIQNRIGTCAFRTYHKTKGAIWTHAALKWIGEYGERHVLLGAFTDISNQVAEDTPGGFFIYAAQEDDQFFFVGENMLRMLGYSREEFQEQISENGCYDKVDYRIEKKDGSLLWVHDEGHYIVDQENRAWFYVTINDISEKVQEQKRLQKENRELGGIINSIPVGLSVYRLAEGQMGLVAANDAMCSMLSVTRREIESAAQDLFSSRVHPEDLAELAATMRRVSTVGRHGSVPFRYAKSKDEWQWLRLESETVRSQDGSYFIYNVISDLTSERRAEEELERSQRERQERFQSSIKALVLANPQSLCTVRLNLSQNKCEEWYGTSPFVIRTIQAETAEGVICNISRMIINEKDRCVFLEHFDRRALMGAFQRGKKSDAVRYRRNVEEGLSVWVETVVNMVENPDTHEIEAVLFSEDVNDRVLNEKIIQKSTDTGFEYIATLRLPEQLIRFRFLGDGDAVSLGNRRTKVALDQVVSYAEIVELAAGTWVSPDELERFRAEAAVENIVERLDRTGSYTLTIKAQKADGTEGWKQIRLAWLEETRDRILIQQTDISDAVRRQQAELLGRLNTERTLRNEADRANESKSNFISNVSHDMRTPLNAILGYDRLALETASAEQKTDYLQKIGEAGETLLSLINDTLDLQKIENGVTTLHPEPVSCGTIVNGIITAVKPLLDAKGIRFVFDNSKAAWATINVDAMRVEEIFINLLSNSAKFTPAGGEVLMSVECVKETDSAICDKLIVRDNGVGISPEFLTKIYDPFAQERNEETAGIGGSGLGLSIVKRLVDLMHGRIEVKSKLGQGTEFTVYLTFPKANDKGAADEAEENVSLALNGRTILLCEDNEMNREIATAILEKNGMSVIPAVNGKEGVDIFCGAEAGEIAAVLMDIRMPVMDGYEASRAIRACGHPGCKTVPIIALSADAYADDVKRAADCGMSGHLSKPIDPDLLLRTLQAVIKAENLGA